jgi:arginine decarboxylase
MMATVQPGATLVLAHNGHKSAFAALVLSGAVPSASIPSMPRTGRWRMAWTLTSSRACGMPSASEGGDGVPPTYYGVSADVKALAEVCHARGLPLMTDDAWGTRYSFSSRLPPSALESGPDLAIGSVHKTLNGFAQTSVPSVHGDRLEMSRLEPAFELAQPTSAWSLLLSSIDAGRRQFERDGEALLGDALDRAERLRAAVRGAARPAPDGLRGRAWGVRVRSHARDVRRARTRPDRVLSGRPATPA